jgi:hypothetical protein
VPTARIVEKRAAECLPPRLQNSLKRPAVQVRAQPDLEQVDDTKSVHRRRDSQIRRSSQAHQERAIDIDAHDSFVSLKLPCWNGAAGELPAQTGMLEEIARMLGSTSGIEIGG